MIISLDVLAVGGGVGREGVVKQMLATQCAYSLKEVLTHTCLRCQRIQLAMLPNYPKRERLAIATNIFINLFY